MNIKAPQVAVIIVLLMATGCASSRHQVKASLPVGRIAILPVHNETDQEAGAILVRDLMERGLTSRGYIPIATSITDKEAARLEIKPETISSGTLRTFQENTGADSVALIDLITFTSTNEGFSSERRVTIRMKLLNAQNGSVLWQQSEEAGKRTTTHNAVTAAWNFAQGLGTQATETLLSSPLYPETSQVVEKLMQALPPYTAASNPG